MTNDNANHDNGSRSDDMRHRIEDHRANDMISPVLREHQAELGLDEEGVRNVAKRVATLENDSGFLFTPETMLAHAREILGQNQEKEAQIA